MMKKLTSFLFVFLYRFIIATSTTPMSSESVTMLPGLVDVQYGIASPAECDNLIAESEEVGYNNGFDSIDRTALSDEENQNSQDIYLVDRGFVSNAHLWKIARPLTERITDYIVETRGGSVEGYDPVGDPEELRVDWVFMRKYSSAEESVRSSLLAHYDTSRLSVVLAISAPDAHTTGGLFFLNYGAVGPSYNESLDPLPVPADTYDYLSYMERRNTSYVIFPYLPQGSIAVYNHTVWHGVAPILDDGWRYSLSIFYNLPPISRTAKRDSSENVGKEGWVCPFPTAPDDETCQLWHRRFLTSYIDTDPGTSYPDDVEAEILFYNFLENSLMADLTVHFIPVIFAETDEPSSPQYGIRVGGGALMTSANDDTVMPWGDFRPFDDDYYTSTGSDYDTGSGNGDVDDNSNGDDTSVKAKAKASADALRARVLSVGRDPSMLVMNTWIGDSFEVCLGSHLVLSVTVESEMDVVYITEEVLLAAGLSATSASASSGGVLCAPNMYTPESIVVGGANAGATDSDHVERASESASERVSEGKGGAHSGEL